MSNLDHPVGSLTKRPSKSTIRNRILDISAKRIKQFINLTSSYLLCDIPPANKKRPRSAQDSNLQPCP